MNFKQLNYFVCVAEELHFGRAAAILHISQPPLSQQIKALEQQLGVTLFKRDRRSVELTESGHIFLKHAYGLIAQFKAALLEVKGVEMGVLGSLNIGYSRSAMYSHEVLNCITAFKAKYTEINVQMQEGSTLRQIEDMVAERIDIALVRGTLPPSAKLLLSQIISRERLVVILPLNHRFANGEKISINALLNERFVLFQREMGTALNASIYTLFKKYNALPEVAIEVTSMSAMLGLVGAGMGVSIVPETVLQAQLSPVKVCPLHEVSAKIELHAVTRREASPVAQNFLRILRENV